MDRIVLFGGGNHVQYCIDIIEKEGKYSIIGIIDSIKTIGEILFGYPVIGKQEDILTLTKEYQIDHGIITVGDNWTRKCIYDAITSLIPDFSFVNAIHPSVIIGNAVKIGKGVIAMAGVIVNPGSTVGNFTFFATGAQIEHDCEIDDFASISAGSIMGGHVKIGKYSAITLGVVIVDRITIGENTVVGSGSLVVKSLPNHVLAYGNPASIIRERKPGERFLK